MSEVMGNLKRKLKIDTIAAQSLGSLGDSSVDKVEGDRSRKGSSRLPELIAGPPQRVDEHSKGPSKSETLAHHIAPGRLP